MCKFKSGDKVRKKDGNLFREIFEVATVSTVIGDSRFGTQVWFKETGTWMCPEDIELVDSLKGFAKFMKKLDAA